MKATLTCVVAAVLLSVIGLESQSPAQSEKGARKNRSAEKTPRQPKNFEVAMTAIGNGRWGAIRYNTGNGQSWKLSDGVWEELSETRQIKPQANSQYRIDLVQTAPGRFGALRLDVRTGQAWELAEQMWRPILDTAGSRH